ncbi:NAD(P)/FAD-dependent oxidoreductase [Bhargavaea ginsengi]|uniref:NAD(P)/FAD-dependent oxidoreductase n=1 Tax=Bhargavaea ginsengi TaxID=426757 RepID=UPI00203BC58F|nr:NAD(P)/FAD-dependent oxidoreductase [Bhargavaea ginsengi]MCM3088486.1 NAD(P)/FAD-dependent oxidoreductase [Bhargavaea ginsengi]
MAEPIRDVTIIGGGPAGLYSAFYSGLRGMDVRLIEAREELGGKVCLFREKMIWDAGGQPPLQGETFRRQLIEQGKTFGPEVLTGTKIAAIRKNGQGLFEAQDHLGKVHLSKAIIMANGGGIVTPQKLRLQGAAVAEMDNLHYTMPSLATFTGKTVLISGGGDAAVDWAEELSGIAAKVILIHRRDNFCAHEAQVEKVRSNGTDIMLNVTIHRLLSDAAKTRIELVELMDTESGALTRVEVDDVVVSHGYERDSELAFEPEPLRKDGHFFEGGANAATTVPGIFAAGDCLSYTGKVNLLVGAFQDAVNAVNRAKTFIEPEAHDRGMVSSHNERFKERNRSLIRQIAEEVKSER